jgi:hypothetical protein
MIKTIKIRRSAMKALKRLSIPGMVMLAVFVLGLGIANANIIPFNTSVTGSGPYTWNYRFDVSADQTAQIGPAPTINPVLPLTIPTLNVGSFLTIYDFFGYVPGSCSGSSGWTCTTQNVGFTPSDTLPTDNPNILNITWTYTGGGSNIVGPASLTGFSAQSTSNLNTTVSYTSRGVKTGDGSIGDNVGTTKAPSAVPEPVTLILFGTGLLGLFGIRRKLS